MFIAHLEEYFFEDGRYWLRVVMELMLDDALDFFVGKKEQYTAVRQLLRAYRFP